MNMKTAIQTVVDRHDFTTEAMMSVMKAIMTGEATPAQIGGFLVGLRMKGETVDEITGAARVMRDLATPVAVRHPHLVDIVGTGGDAQATFNISTASTFVVAAAGGKVAKHGNRAVSSKSGSADLLEAAGVNLNLDPEQIARCITEVGVGFMFAPQHHSAMKHAIGPRREMGIRTLFNLLGPLTNPASVSKQLLGIYSQAWQRPIAEVLQRLGSDHVLVVHSDDGLDEISIAGSTHVVELKAGNIHEYAIAPEDFGLERHPLESIRITTPEESLSMIRQALTGQHKAAADTVAMNAGAALYACDIAKTIAAGVDLAQDAIGSGQALVKLEELASFTQCMETEKGIS